MYFLKLVVFVDRKSFLLNQVSPYFTYFDLSEGFSSWVARNISLS